MRFNRIAVLTGGPSLEREQSLATGRAVATVLGLAGYEPHEILVDDDLVQNLARLAPDAVFNALHGGSGENGVIQGLLEHMRLPYTHSGVLASARAANRHEAKTRLMAANVPVTAHVLAGRTEVAEGHVIDAPYVVKPATARATAGIFHVASPNDHPPHQILEPAWQGGELLMVERFVPGRDMICAVIGDVAIGVAERAGRFDFANSAAKEKKTEQNLLIPAQVSSNLYENIQKMSLKAHEALGCRGITRVDFRLSGQKGGGGDIVCLGVTTQPDLTPHSVVVELAAKSGHSFVELVRWIMEDASCNR